jgi:hypothetical protein
MAAGTSEAMLATEVAVVAVVLLLDDPGPVLAEPDEVLEDPQAATPSAARATITVALGSGQPRARRGMGDTSVKGLGE